MKNLLIVEDDPNTLAGLLELFREEGYQVHGARNGRKAVELVAAGRIDAVLCDYCLPDINGLEVCRVLKILEPRLAAFLVTAYYNARIVNTAREYKIVQIFTKPIVFDNILETIFNQTKD